MNTLLIFFAIPIAVIIVSAVLQKLLNSPITVAALIFAIFLVVTFAAFDSTFLIATFAYTLLALITALIVKFLCESKDNTSLCDLLRDFLSNNENNETNLSNISDLLNSNNTNSNNSTNNNSCGCSRYNRYRRF